MECVFEGSAMRSAMDYFDALEIIVAFVERVDEQYLYKYPWMLGWPELKMEFV